MKTPLLTSIFLTFCLVTLLPWSHVIAKDREDFGLWGAIQGQGSFSSDPKLNGNGNGNGGWKGRRVGLTM